jgi:hypothetical protein
MRRLAWFVLGLLIGGGIAFADAATTTTFAPPAMWPVVVCDGAAYSKNTKAQTFTITCPTGSATTPPTLVVTGCANPVLTAPAVGQLKLTC